MSLVRSARCHALLSAYLSIAAGITITILAIIAATQENSMSLYGVAFMAMIDSTGSVLVLMIYQSVCSSVDLNGNQQHRREAQYSFLIGILMLILGVVLFTDR